MAQDQTPPDKQLLLHRIYLKQLSIRSPQVPEIYMSNVPADTNLDLNSMHRDIDEQQTEVVLTLKVTFTSEQNTFFEAELAVAGLFELKGHTPAERFTVLGAVCPSGLYPYAREALNRAVQSAGFPQLLIAPVDFDGVLAENLRARAAAATAEGNGAAADGNSTPPPDPAGGGPAA